MEGNHRGKVESKEIFYAELEEFAREKDTVRKSGRLHINVAELLGFLALLFPLLRIRNPSGTLKYSCFFFSAITSAEETTATPKP